MGKMMSAEMAVRVLLGAAIVLLIVFAVFKFKKEYFSNDDDDDVTITFYHMEGCGWCKKAEPEWEKCTKMAPSKNVKTAKVSSDEISRDDMQKLGINGFPTFVVTYGNKDIKYDGDRTADAMFNYVDQLRMNGIENFADAKKVAETFIRTGNMPSEGFSNRPSSTGTYRPKTTTSPPRTTP